MRAWEISEAAFRAQTAPEKVPRAAVEWKAKDEAAVKMKAGKRGEFCAIPKDAEAFASALAEKSEEAAAPPYEGEWLFYFVELA